MVSHQPQIRCSKVWLFLLLVIPRISFCLDAKRNKKVKAASAKAEILNVRTKIKVLGGCSSAFS